MTSVRKLAGRAIRRVFLQATEGGLAQDTTVASGRHRVWPGMPELCRRAAAEGTVLLANDGTLPLSPTDEVAVFGRCQLDWFFMGYGSGGDVNPPYAINLMEALESSGVRINHVLAEVYRSWCADAANATDPGWWAHWPTHRPEMPLDARLAHACARTAQTALVVLGRSAGEGMDMPLCQGGYYLTNREHALLATVTAAFEHTVVVINTSNVVDLAWVEAFGSKISSVLLAWQGGMEAGNAVADVLYGRVNPSGKLTSSIARRYDAYPSSSSFGDRHRVDYLEGIRVGYRHFDAFAPDDVLFPFGHGLSYTTFSTELLTVERTACALVARARVTNTGPRPGREVVQLWCLPPRGTIEKPVRILSAFCKTHELASGQSQTVELACDLKTLASFDQRRNAFVLEAGTYGFEAGTSVTSEISDDIVVERCEPLCTTSRELRTRILSHLSSLDSEPTDESTLPGIMCPERLGDEELRALTCGEGFMNSDLGAPGNAGALGGVTPSLREKGIPAIICADGPSGARLQRHCSMLPCATALACTWDTQLVEKLYTHAGEEIRDCGVDVLLAPGMNIQRDPRCGRNFEYFSEDPLVSGRMGGAVVRGLQRSGVSACPKHFACNNQELRRNTCDSRVSERTLREIYLRGFEICVREARPDLVMTSYNKVNGIWAHYHFDLVTTVLRGEWGFEGVVVTDWWMHPARSPEFPRLRDNAYRLRAGVDVLMPGIPKAVRGITRIELERTATRVLRLSCKRQSD